MNWNLIKNTLLLQKRQSLPFSFQRVLEEVIENSYIGSFKSIKKLVSTGASLDLLHSANEKEVEELRIRMQSPDCIDAALKVLTKSRKTISKL